MDPVTLEVPVPHVAVVTIQRPDARNAVNRNVASLLGRYVKVVEDDPDIWAAVLTGAGGIAFCAGADLKEVSAGRLNELYTEDGAFAGFVKYPKQKVWIAAVDGFAMAGGCEIALACDMVVAAEQSVFSLPEVTRGLVAAAGGVYRIVRALPRAIGLELVATGQRLAADRAAHFGLVNKVVPRGEALCEAIKLAMLICENAPIAVWESMAVARLAFDRDDDALFALGLEAQERVMQTEDFSEGPLAFIEKRAAVWKGR